MDIFKIIDLNERPFSMKPATNTLCSGCGQPLTEIDFNRTHYAYRCLNWQCRLYRQPQGNREKTLAEQQRWGQKNPVGPEPAKRIVKSKLRPGYDNYLETKRINYRHLRDLGVSSIEARNSTSKKRTKQIERQSRRKEGEK